MSTAKLLSGYRVDIAPGLALNGERKLCTLTLRAHDNTGGARTDLTVAMSHADAYQLAQQLMAVARAAQNDAHTND